MASEMEQLLEELRGVRTHLAELASTVEKYRSERYWEKLNGDRTILEEQQKEFDLQAQRWRVYQTMTPEEFEEWSLKQIEKMAGPIRS